jgi:hypothetical protein
MFGIKIIKTVNDHGSMCRALKHGGTYEMFYQLIVNGKVAKYWWTTIQAPKVGA